MTFNIFKVTHNERHYVTLLNLKPTIALSTSLQGVKALPDPITCDKVAIRGLFKYEYK